MKKLLATGVLSVAMLTMLSGCISISVNDGGKNTSVNIGKKVSTTLSTKKFTNLSIDTNDANIVFQTSDKYQVKYSGGKKLMPTIKQNGDSLTIKEKSSFSININSDSQTPTITITMPEAKLNKIAVSTADGDISGKKINAKTINLSSDDGDIKFDSLITNSGKIDLADGDATIDSLKTTAGYHINSDDGDITIHKSNASGFILNSDDGDIRVGSAKTDSNYTKNSNSKNVLHVSTADGDIDIN